VTESARNFEAEHHHGGGDARSGDPSSGVRSIIHSTKQKVALQETESRMLARLWHPTGPTLATKEVFLPRLRKKPAGPRQADRYPAGVVEFFVCATTSSLSHRQFDRHRLTV
jgi:hypothetical protein